MRRNLIALVVIAVIAVAVGGWLGTRGSGAPALVTPSLADLEGLKQEGAVIGSARAPVTVTVFVDLNQPASKEVLERVLPAAVQQLVRTDKARLALWFWPVMGDNAVASASAAYAAERQNRLWQFVRIAAANQGNPQSWWDEKVARKIGKASGLDVGRFESDALSAEVNTQLLQNVQTAIGIGLKLPPGYALESRTGRRRLLPADTTAPQLVAAVAAASS